MLHTFTINGDYLAFDSENQALLALSEPFWNLLKCYDPLTGEAPSELVLAEWRQMYPEEQSDLEEVMLEIGELRDSGKLFGQATEVRLDQLYPEKPLIKSMCLHICHDCNLRCRYCFAGQGDYNSGMRDMMSLEVGQKAIDFLIEASGHRHNLDIDFFGGEPLLNWAVVTELVDYCEQRAQESGKDLRLTMTTNGLLLDKEKRDYINEHFKNVVLSIDGRPDVHNYMRPSPNGKASFEPIIKNIKAMVEERGDDKEFYVRGTFTHFNTDFAEDIRYLAEQDLKQISMEPVVAAPEDPYALTAEDIEAVLEEYEKLALVYADEKDGSHPYRFFHFNLDLEEGPCAYKRLKGCGVGSEYIAVTPQGDIYPCHQFVGKEEFLMGNVLKDGPDQLSEEVKELFSQHLVPDRTPCDRCWARYFCAGGCIANHYNASGSLDGIYEEGCRLQKKRLEAALWVKYRERVDNRVETH